MSATRLLVLGVVRAHGETHGYEVRRELQLWAADKWANVKPGSIYHALKQLAKEQLLEDVGTEEGASGPERTRYRLTEDGETEFLSLLCDSLSVAERGPDTLSAGISFLTALDRAQAVNLLRHRAIDLQGTLRSAQHSVESWTDLGKPAHVAEVARLWVRAAEMEIAWTEELIGRLEAGEYVMADDPGHSFGEPATMPHIAH